MLNFIWAGFFIAGFLAAAYQGLIIGNGAIWAEMVTAVFATAKSAFTIAINLTGILCLWLGLLKIAEVSGLTQLLAKALYPLFRKIMPGIPENHPALGSMVMNIAANVLGLDNAATPMGLKAMEQLQTLNSSKDTASDAQILFMVLNASIVTLIPITILMYRSELGSSNPAAVFLPILLATSTSTLVGFFSVAWVQKLNIFNRTVLAYLGGFALFILLVSLYFSRLPENERLAVSSACGNFIFCAVIAVFIIAGLYKKVNVYDTFIQGAKEGFDIAVRIIPYLVAMLVAIGVLRASGVLDFIVWGFGRGFELLGLNTDFVAALPTAIMKPLSGSGARAMMIETLRNYGADSFQGFVASIVQGSTETTFYVLAVYFGAVKITKVKEALPCALLADFAGITAAILLAYYFY